MFYLKGLSYDAIPEVEGFLEAVKDSSDLQEEQIYDEIIKYFEQKKVGLENQKNWQSFNISRYRAEKIIDKYID